VKKATTTKSEIVPTKPTQDRYAALYEVYALWRSLPVSILSQVSRDELVNRFGIDDENVANLVQIKTQTAFAEKYDLSIDTLTDWNKKIREKDPLIEARQWALSLTKNVVLSLYNHAIRKGNAELYKLFFKVVNEWQEKIKIDPVKGTVIFNFEAIDKEDPLDPLPLPEIETIDDTRND
jgi:hypothetical protein